MIPPWLLQCPVCQLPLVPAMSCAQNGYQCQNQHRFDVAKQGYLNLLLAHQKHTKVPGDSLEMISSRRQFLNRGFYDPLAQGINQVIANCYSVIPVTLPITILDAGCGEGFYLKSLKDSWSGILNCYGVDISKYAIRQATQRDKAINWIVSSSAALPFLESSVDVLVSAFAPVHFSEFARVLKPQGKLVLVTPGANHLSHLRQIIYPIVRERKQAPILEKVQDLFIQTSNLQITYDTEITNSVDILNLLAMTPHYWTSSLAAKSRVESLTHLELNVDVNISLFEKTVMTT